MACSSSGFLKSTACAVGTAVLSLAVWAGAARAAGPVAGTTRLGPAPAAASIRLALPLSADPSGLEQFATAVSTPGSSEYGHYESIAQLARRFGAPAGERRRVLEFLRRSGATGIRIDATGLVADATLTVGEAQRLFHTSVAAFGVAHTTRYVAPDGAVRIPAGLRGAVTGVVGLDTEPIATHPQISAEPSAVLRSAVEKPAQTAPTAFASGYQTRTGTATGCAAATAQPGFTPNQYLTAYGYAPLQAAGFEGQGERVALIEIDGFRASDLRGFDNCFGLPTPAIKGFLVGLNKPLPAGGESTLDLEVLNAAAPKLKEVDVYESGPTAVDVLSSLTAPLQNHGYKPDVISVSLGACESATLQAIGTSGLQAAESTLEVAAASGITVLASSGDDGSSACVDQSGAPQPVLAVSYPASSPWVTGVGGTNFILTPTNTISSQDVWNDAPLPLAAGGGGDSQLFSRPSYQAAAQAGPNRGVPDVSMLADVSPGYEIFCTVSGDCVNQATPGPWTQVGGTSASSPLLAGGVALVDQDLRIQGKQDLGLLNPLLYEIDGLPAAAQVISPVSVGDNDLGTSIPGDGSPLGCCTATAGYNLAAGLGSINISGLAFAVSGLVAPIVSVALTLPHQADPVGAGALKARVSCSGRCLMGAYARIRVGRSPRLITDYSNAYLLRNGAAKTIKIPFAKADLTRLRAALASHDPINATIYGVVLDPGGNVDRSTAGLRLRITN
ncbi:MAG: protease pro-enzyme activation domain-containing protein [Solirubrobacteraceae bacterium]